MAIKIYVGNLSWGTTDEKLKAEFEKYGPVVSAMVWKDKFTGRSRGFAFVEMENEEDANKAIEAMNDKDFDGRKIIVNIAKPLEDRPPRERRDRFKKGYDF